MPEHNKYILMTEEGLKNLENELENLKTVKRKEIAEKIKLALSFGDLSENSEYDEAKNEQAMAEARIAEIESILKKAKVIDEHELSTEIVHVGSLVRIQDMADEQEYQYKIVGSSESDPINGRISDESPIGKGLLEHKVDDIVEIDTPGGTCKYRIMEISK